MSGVGLSAGTVGVVVALGLLALLLHLLDRHLCYGIGGKQRRVQGARWAKRGDLRDLRVGGSKRGRLVLGKQGRRLVATTEQASVVVVGPSRISNKTTGFTIPALLEWEGPVVATSVKSDLLFETFARRRQMGKTMVFDPTGATGVATVQATPLSACGSWRGAMRVAHLLSVSSQGGGGLEDAGFWYAAAEKLLAPLLFAAAEKGGTMADVIRWLDDGAAAEPEVREALSASQCEEALSAWRANWNREERQRSSIYTTAETVVRAFADPRVLEHSTRADYTPAELLDGGSNTLYLCAPAHEQERLRGLFAAMLSELVGVVYEIAAATGKPLDPPLLLVLDEAANTAPMPDLDVVASTGAGQGIQLVTVFQDFAQVEARWGREAATIINNHQAKVFPTGNSDPATLRYIREVLGEGEYVDQRTSSGRNASQSEGQLYKPLAPANMVREQRPGSGLLIYGHRPPARIKLRPWFKDRDLTAMVEARR
jgi:type IV secretion system protein VirD4